jgi:ribosome-binding factor A
VYIAVDGGEAAEADTVAALIAARGYIRHELLTRLGVRRVPDLSFHVDRSEKFQLRIDELLGRVKKRKKTAEASESNLPPVQNLAGSNTVVDRGTQK